MVPWRQTQGHHPWWSHLTSLIFDNLRTHDRLHSRNHRSRHLLDMSIFQWHGSECFLGLHLSLPLWPCLIYLFLNCRLTLSWLLLQHTLLTLSAIGVQKPWLFLGMAFQIWNVSKPWILICDSRSAFRHVFSAVASAAVLPIINSTSVPIANGITAVCAWIAFGSVSYFTIIYISSLNCMLHAGYLFVWLPMVINYELSLTLVTPLHNTLPALFII